MTERPDDLIAAAAIRQQELIDQFASAITATTPWPDRVVRITVLTAALGEIRRDLLDVLDSDPALSDAVTEALSRLDTDREAAAHLLDACAALASAGDGASITTPGELASAAAGAEYPRPRVDPETLDEDSRTVLNDMMGKLIVLAPAVSSDGLAQVLDRARAAAFLQSVLDDPDASAGRQSGARTLADRFGVGPRPAAEPVIGDRLDVGAPVLTKEVIRRFGDHPELIPGHVREIHDDGTVTVAWTPRITSRVPANQLVAISRNGGAAARFDGPGRGVVQGRPSPGPNGNGSGRNAYMDKPGAIGVLLTADQATLAQYRFNYMLTGNQADDDWYGAYVAADGQSLLVHDRAATLREIDNALEILNDNLNPPAGGGGFADAEDLRRWRMESRRWQQTRRRVETAVPDGFTLPRPADPLSVDGPPLVTRSTDALNQVGDDAQTSSRSSRAIGNDPLAGEPDTTAAHDAAENTGSATPADITPAELVDAQRGDQDAPGPVRVQGESAQERADRVLGASDYRVNQLMRGLNPQDSGAEAGQRRVDLGRQITVSDRDIAGEAPELERLADTLEAGGPYNDQWIDAWPRQLREAAQRIRQETGTELPNSSVEITAYQQGDAELDSAIERLIRSDGSVTATTRGVHVVDPQRAQDWIDAQLVDARVGAPGNGGLLKLRGELLRGRISATADHGASRVPAPGTPIQQDDRRAPGEDVLAGGLRLTDDVTAQPDPGPGAPATAPDTSGQDQRGASARPSPSAAHQPAAAEASNFELGSEIRVPSGAKARVRANLAAIRVVRVLDIEDRAATADEQQILARWSGWGAVPQVFDTDNDEFAGERAEVRDLLTDGEYRQAEASILNAHYTDPAVAAQMWTALRRAGFSGGRVLEPGCGSGNFIGLAPPDAVMVGVENDALTARIATALYPQAQVRSEDFATTRVAENAFVATVGNVPFGNYPVYDPAHNAARHSIHNYFILKSLALTAPGGYVAAITSRYTMDALDSRARTAIAARADLVGAVRLPGSAFKTVAGTTVVTDILLFRKREEDAPHDPHPSWLDVQEVPIGRAEPADTSADRGPAAAGPVPVGINSYFVTNPHRVLGEMSIGHGQYGAATLRVEADPAYSAELVGQHLGELVDAALDAGQGLTATAAQVAMAESPIFAAGLVTAAAAAEQVPLDTLRFNAELDIIERWSGSEWVDNNTAKARVGETRELIELRDIATTLIHAQLGGSSAVEKDQLRALLNRRYDTYVETHGPINRFKMTEPTAPTRAMHDEKLRKAELQWRRKNATEDGPHTGPVPEELLERWDAEAWEPAVPQKRRAHLSGGIRHDPGWATVAALEHFDERHQTTRKAAIFAADVIAPPTPRESADTPQEALAISAGEGRGIDLARVAQLRAITAAEAREELRGLIFADPADPDTFISAPTYLSGNVRDKLAQAETAAQQDPQLLENVVALREMIPPDLHASQIKVRPGMTWIPADDLADFIREVLRADRVTVEYTLQRWVIEVPTWQRSTVVMTEEYGTTACDAVELLDKVCNSRSIQVMNTPAHVNDHPNEEINLKATFAARAKADKIEEEFADWLFRDETRRERLVTEYNRRFNGLRAPRHDGTYLTFPGMSEVFTPHPYQRNAVARILHEPTVLLDHVVGAGKSGTMFMGAMELKRLGLVRQPWIVVPNHIIDQIGREAKQWYPAARILMGTAGTDADERRRLIAQSAASDWDMAIVPLSAFTLIGVSPQLQMQYVEKSLDELRTQLEDRTIGSTRSSKKIIERAVKAAKARLEQLTDQASKDTGPRFEQSGCDYLFMDEAHMFKNLPRISNIAELACTGLNKRPQDLDLKLDVLRQRRRDEAAAAGRAGDGVDRVATFATGTPIMNGLGESWVMQHYMRPDLLEAAGVSHIDAWGMEFTDTVTRIEMNATGSKMIVVTRVGKYVNLPEMLALSAVFSDVVTRDQVPVGLPQLVGGQRSIVTTQPDVEVRDFITDLGFRSDQLDPRDPRRDNQLKISSDGRNASLDPRLAHLGAPADGGRARAVAREILRIHAYSKDRRYLDEFGSPHPDRGAVQIVFCDRGTPKANTSQFTVYAAIRDELIAGGMDPAAIRFIHDARPGAERLQLQADCRSGAVAVIMGSTEKMGTGTNIQTRAIALHHVDVPWRPGDLEQREGRIIRQGNQNTEVEILNYVAEGSYDTVMWQKVESKAVFINQAKRNEVGDLREVEDLGGGDIGESAAATKAIATGDPRYLRQVELDETVQRLSALAQAHQEATRAARLRLSRTRASVSELTDQIAALDEVLIRHPASSTSYTVYPQLTTTGDIGRYTERKDAALAFADACRQVWARKAGAGRFLPVGAVNGIDVLAAHELFSGDLVLTLSVPSATRQIQPKTLFGTGTPAPEGPADSPESRARGILQRAENLYKELPEFRDGLLERRRITETDLADLEALGETPFEHAGELEARRLELTELTTALRLESQSEAALAKSAAAAERLAATGREPGWSLLLNPTPAVVEEAEAQSADELRQRVLAVQALRAADYARKQARTSRPAVQPRPGNSAAHPAAAAARAALSALPDQAPAGPDASTAAAPPAPATPPRGTTSTQRPSADSSRRR